ncbi:uncharacterized protein LOC134838268 [Culicoides brevitarsis]|uniref:uncharacterized protein LOC134838268 n=1 Tax=Culicoides brevitarsis TaxID=469753 RepID=UPI00307B633B
MLPMDDLLPEDEVLVQRKDRWEDFFLQRKDIEEDEEAEGLAIDEISDVLDKSLEIELEEKEKAPEAVEVVEEPNAACEEESKRSLTKALQVAIKEREVEWKQKGLKFTFNKVDEWLKQSETQNRRETVDPKGGHTVEESNQRVMQVKRKYRGSAQSKDASDSNDITDDESDTEVSDASFSNSSVDTAKYIRANQNKRTKVTKKTIIKKYVVTEHVDRRRSSISKSHTNRLKAVPAITEGTSSNHAKKKRKTRHTLNQLRKPPQKYSSSSDEPRSEDESPHLNPPKKPFLPSFSLDEILLKPAESPEIITPPNKSQNSSIEASIEEILLKQPRIVLKPIAIEDSPITRKTPRKLQRTISYSSESSNASKMNETAKSTYSRYSSVFNMSRKSWAHLPKKSILYTPSANTSQDSTVNISNEHFEQVFGAETASELLQAQKITKEVDATATVVFEIPDSEDELSCESSDVDPMDCNMLQKPRLKIVRDG